MACLAISLKAIFCADNLAAEAIKTAEYSRSGKSILHCMACIPPRLPPITAANFWIPRWSARCAWLATQSLTTTLGKFGPNISPVLGSMEFGPVLPWQPPRLFRLRTKKLSVSMHFPGPIQASHQPGLESVSYTHLTLPTN